MDDDCTPQEKLRDLEAAEAEQDRRAAENERRYREKLLELYDEALWRRAEAMSEITVWAQDELERRLREFDIIADGEEPTRLSVQVGDEVFAGLEHDGRRYAWAGAGAGDVIIVEQIAAGGYPERAMLDENGEPGPWSSPERDN
jgi:hypothetical protein